MRTRRTAWVATLMGAATCMGGDALAVDLPQRKPGLWEITLHMAEKNRPPPVMKLCIDAATDAEFLKLGMSTMQGMCSRNDIQRNGNIVTMDAECRMGESKMTSHSVMTFTGDIAYKADVTSHFDPPMMGLSDLSMTQEARWASPCPGDMRPGDMIGPTGAKMNLKSPGR